MNKTSLVYELLYKLFFLLILSKASFTFADNYSIHSGVEQSSFSVNLVGIKGSGTGSGTWYSESDGSIVIYDKSTIKTRFSTTRVSTKVKLTLHGTKWKGTTTTLVCSGTCTDIRINTPNTVYDVEVHLDKHHFGQIKLKTDNITPIGKSTTEATYNLTSNGYLYMINDLDNTISIFNTGKLSVVKSGINLNASHKSQPKKMTGDANRQLLYIADAESESVIVFSTKENAEVARVHVAGAASDVALANDNRRLYVTLKDKSKVAVLNTDSRTLEKYIVVGREPVSIVIKADGARAFVANSASDDISIIDLGNHEVSNTIKTDKSPTSLDLSPNRTMLYAVCEETIFAYNLQAHTSHSITGVSHPAEIIFSTNKLAYATSKTQQRLYALDVNKQAVSHSYELDGLTTSITASADKSLLYMTLAKDNKTTVIAFDTSTNTITSESDPLPHTSFHGIHLAPVPTVGLLRVQNYAWVNVHGKCHEANHSDDDKFTLLLAQRHTCKAGSESVQVSADLNQKLGKFYPKQNCPVNEITVKGTLFKTWVHENCAPE